MTNKQAIAKLTQGLRGDSEAVFEVAAAFGGTGNSIGQKLWCAAMNLRDCEEFQVQGRLEIIKYRGRIKAGLDQLSDG